MTPAPLCGTLFGLFYFFPVFRAFVPLAVFVIFQWYLVNPPVPDQIGWLNLTKSAVGKISDSYHSTSKAQAFEHRALECGGSRHGGTSGSSKKRPHKQISDPRHGGHAPAQARFLLRGASTLPYLEVDASLELREGGAAGGQILLGPL